MPDMNINTDTTLPDALPQDDEVTRDEDAAGGGEISIEDALRTLIEAQIMQDIAAKYKAEEIDGGVWEPGATSILQSF